MATETPHKGIMLCERPAHAIYELPAFQPPSVGRAPLGLSPLKKQYVPTNPKTDHKMPSAIALNKQWVKEIEQQQKIFRQQQQQAEKDEEAKKEVVGNFGEKLRTAILNGEHVSEFWKAAPPVKASDNKNNNNTKALEAVEVSESKNNSSDASIDVSNKMLKDVDDFVDQICMEATTALIISKTEDPQPSSNAKPSPSKENQAVRPGTSDSTRSSTKKAMSKKPAWALSETEVVELQEAEEDELLDFAENLDFDNFLSSFEDPELLEKFKDLQEAETDGTGDKAWRKTFVRALNHATLKQIQNQKQSIDDDAQSEGAMSRISITSRARTEATAARLAVLAGKTEEQTGNWETISKGGDPIEKAAAVSQFRAAEDFLAENPDLKSVHSVASVRSLLNKIEQKIVSAS